MHVKKYTILPLQMNVYIKFIKYPIQLKTLSRLFGFFYFVPSRQLSLGVTLIISLERCWIHIASLRWCKCGGRLLGRLHATAGAVHCGAAYWHHRRSRWLFFFKSKAVHFAACIHLHFKGAARAFHLGFAYIWMPPAKWGNTVRSISDCGGRTFSLSISREGSCLWVRATNVICLLIIYSSEKRLPLETRLESNKSNWCQSQFTHPSTAPWSRARSDETVSMTCVAAHC